MTDTAYTKQKKFQIKYLAAWEKQKRGAIHDHIVLFKLPYLPHSQLVQTWGHGIIGINRIDIDALKIEVDM
ncbi:rolling circle replication-associated protein [Listeria seeligeri]|uniref:rolling circle replication-associated protein n=1 Tax=Listeria seeligeri TaxID=1640 RepID=UPI00406AB3DB